MYTQYRAPYFSRYHIRHMIVTHESIVTLLFALGGEAVTRCSRSARAHCDTVSHR